MASTHVSLISAGGTNNRRIASSIYGYCTTAAATAAKTVSLYTGNGTTADGTWAAADLFHGLTITVRFQYTNTVASPTLNVNGTGDKPIYRYGVTKPSTNVLSSWQAHQIVTFTYDTLLNSSGCWVMHRGYRSDTYNKTKYEPLIQSGSDGINKDNLIVANSNGYYQNLKSGAAFNITYPILYANSSIGSNSGGDDNYLAISFIVTSTQNISLVTFKPVFIKGTLNGVIFTPISTAPLTQSIPNSQDGYQYYYVGNAYNSTSGMYLVYDHPIYEYKNGAFRLYGTFDKTSVCSYHTTVTFNSSATLATINVQHNLNTPHIIVSVNVTDDETSNTFIASQSAFAPCIEQQAGDAGDPGVNTPLFYGVKIVDNNNIQLKFLTDSWHPDSGTLAISVISAIAYASASDESYIKIS